MRRKDIQHEVPVRAVEQKLHSADDSTKTTDSSEESSQVFNIVALEETIRRVVILHCGQSIGLESTPNRWNAMRPDIH